MPATPCSSPATTRAPRYSNRSTTRNRPRSSSGRGRRSRVTDNRPHEGASDSAAALAAAVIEEEARRGESVIVPETLLADADLPGVDERAMSLREAIRLGGARTIAIVSLLGAIELMDNGVFNVLAPDIQRSLGVSDAVLGAIGGATGVLFVLGAIPMSSLSDRMPRKRLIAATMSTWAVIILLTGTVQNALQMFLARLGAVPRTAKTRARDWIGYASMSRG